VVEFWQFLHHKARSTRKRRAKTGQVLRGSFDLQGNEDKERRHRQACSRHQIKVTVEQTIRNEKARQTECVFRQHLQSINSSSITFRVNRFPRRDYPD
jgi:hypothetical protein